MNIVYSKRALRQIDEALGYIAKRSPSGAANVEARLRAVLSLIAISPLVGRKTKVSGVRRIFLTPYPYLIDYQRAEGEIFVLRFRHASRDPSEIPEKA